MNTKYSIGQIVKHEETIKKITITPNGITYDTTAENRYTDVDLDKFVVLPASEPVAAPVEDKPLYHSGDKVKITGNHNCNNFEIGKIVTLASKYEYSRTAWNVEEKSVCGNQWVVLESDIEPYVVPSEPSQPKLIVTRQMLVELGACQDGKELFDHCFSDDNAPFEAVMLIAKARGAGISAENWLIRNKSTIESMQSEQKKETVKLYCAKDYNPGRTLTKGKIYEFVDGIVTYDGGQKSHPMLNAKEFCEAVNATVGKTAIVSLEKRPAKVGEYVLVTENPSNDNHGDYRKGEIYKVQKIAGTGKFVNKKANAHNESISGMYQLLDNEYLVLDNYAPEEPKEEYWSGKVVCVNAGDAPEWWTKGKVYTYKNGYTTADNGEKSPYGTPAIKNIEELENYGNVKFIEFKGEV